MSGKTEQDKQKAVQEKHQAILCELLRLDDNKYCVDCDAKGECLFFAGFVRECYFPFTWTDS